MNLPPPKRDLHVDGRRTWILAPGSRVVFSVKRRGASAAIGLALRAKYIILYGRKV
jgi:hypothetical protein